MIKFEEWLNEGSRFIKLNSFYNVDMASAMEFMSEDEFTELQKALRNSKDGKVQLVSSDGFNCTVRINKEEFQLQNDVLYEYKPLKNILCPSGTKEFRILSPDGFDIEESGKIYHGKKEVLDAMNRFIQRYVIQGYYSSPRFGRISLRDNLEEYCEIIPASDNRLG